VNKAAVLHNSVHHRLENHLVTLIMAFSLHTSETHM